MGERRRPRVLPWVLLALSGVLAVVDVWLLATGGRLDRDTPVFLLGT